MLSVLDQNFVTLRKKVFINAALKPNRSECGAGRIHNAIHFSCNNLQTSIRHLYLLSVPKAAMLVPQLLRRSGE